MIKIDSFINKVSNNIIMVSRRVNAESNTIATSTKLSKLYILIVAQDTPLTLKQIKESTSNTKAYNKYNSSNPKNNFPKLSIIATTINLPDTCPQLTIAK
jgi:hypothetical protein